MSEPFLVVRVRREATMPATVTYCPSAKRSGPPSAAKSAMIAPILTAPAARAASRYSSMGWPLR